MYYLYNWKLGEITPGELGAVLV